MRIKVRSKHSHTILETFDTDYISVEQKILEAAN